MELDDFRRKWQQTDTGHEAVPASAAAAPLFPSAPDSPVQQMLKSIRFEVGSAWLSIAIGLAVLLLTADAYSRAMACWILVLSVMGLRYFHHKKQLILQLQASHDTVHATLDQRLRTLRQLLHRYRLSTLWTLPITFGIGFFMQLYHLTQEYAGSLRLLMLAATIGGYLLIGLFTYWVMNQLVQWYLQRLYGQHLDRLEAALRELGE